MQEHLITVSEGCQQLGVSERTLRRVLRDPDLQAQMRIVTKQVRGRTREVLMIPPRLLVQLQQKFMAESKSTEEAVGSRKTPKEFYVGRQTGITFNTATLVVVYQRLVHEKDMVINQQNERIGDLLRALEHERNQSRRTQLQALNRRALDASGEKVMVSADIYAELQRLFGEKAVTSTQEDQAAQPAATPDLSKEDQLAKLNIAPTALVHVYEWTLNEKDAVIEQQQARIADLLAAVEHERDQSQRAQLFFEVSPGPRAALEAPAPAPTVAVEKPFWKQWWFKL